MVVAANEKECQLILSLADTEFDKDDQDLLPSGS